MPIDTFQRPISITIAGNVLLVLFALLFLFHILVIAGVVPSNVVWGGRGDASAGSLTSLELLALLVTVLFAIIIAAKMGYIRSGRFQRASRVGMWIIFAYLVLNTIGNFASNSTFEMAVFGPVTVVMALCAFRLAID